MSKKGFIKMVNYDCPICDRTHDVEHREEMSRIKIKGEEVEYMAEYFRCPIQSMEGEDSWTPAGILDNNLLRARDEYRKKHDLLTSSEIKIIRKKYGLTQKELSNLLGLGNITISRYETTHIQDEIYDTALRNIMNQPEFGLDELMKHKKLFHEERFLELRDLFKTFIKAEGLVKLKRQEIVQQYMDFDTACDANGFQLLDISKISDMMAYFSNYVNYLYKVKLMKLLWYADVLYYQKHGRSMSGLVYQHMPLGALPIGHNELVYLPSVQVQEEETMHGTSYHILPIHPPLNPVFSLDEQEVLNKVAIKFKNFRSKEIVDYMHEEEAYKNTSQEDIILFSQTVGMIDF